MAPQLPRDRRRRPPEPAGNLSHAVTLTPTSIAVSSLDRPAAMNAQNRRRSSRRATPGRPGDLSLPRPAPPDPNTADPPSQPPSIQLLRRPLEDRQCAALAYRKLLAEHKLAGSGRRGNPYDNAKAESFMKTLKVEAVYPRPKRPSTTSWPICRASSISSTMLAGCTQLSATAAPSTSRINTPSAWSKPQHDAVHRKGRTPVRGISAYLCRSDSKSISPRPTCSTRKAPDRSGASVGGRLV